ncbi:tripartite tricarboxylate transporter substrate binding protein [Achromobacter sp. GG226]|uniref:tripartite tricarboxylate transporter substrate binding protein n=1 Tax=Verticiella alkaliphila TaxID=2779529 RepID=UPI001C0D1962|nr:tripartite tricarboxylate transporter substrate binding protein [Verticiella sp. GG226]
MFRFAAAALTAFALAGAALAQGYPSRPVRLIVPYPPGGTTDMIARLYADKLSSRLGANVIVENKPGAATNIGSDVVARATADGYTLLFSASGSTSSTVFGPAPTFDPLKDFQPISMISELPFVIAANPKAAFTTWPELVAMAKTNPGKYTIASAQLDVYVELLRSRADIDILHVPYKGGAQSATDAIAGQVDMAFALVPVVLPHVESGSLRALATTAGQRSERLPDTPTLVELGIDYDVTSWYALTGPAGLPPEIVTRLSGATREAVTDPDFIAKLKDIGAIAIASTPQELDARIRAQLAVWQNIAKQFPKLVKTQ